MKQKTRRGSGRIYQPKGSSIWWIEVWINGVQHRETTREYDKQEALAFLERRRAEIAMGRFNGSTSKVTISELMEDVLAEARIKRLKSYVDIEGRWRLHLKPAFGHLKAAQLTRATLKEHVERRLAAGAKPATVNRELEVLKRAYNLGAQSDPPKVLRVPHFPRLKENNVRQGFLDIAGYERILEQCIIAGPWMRGVFELGYTLGWREAEVLNLRADQVDLLNRCVRLNPGETKNDDGRLAFMTTSLYNAIAPLMQRKCGDDYVFTRDDGSQVVDLRKTWRRVCVAAGQGKLFCRKCQITINSVSHCSKCEGENIGYRGLLFHDLRRTAVRNMVRRGVPEKWAMAISGHKTRSMFDRYTIVSESDLREAALRTERGFKAELEKSRATARAKQTSRFPHSNHIAARVTSGDQAVPA